MPELVLAYVYISHYYDGSDNEYSSSDPGVTDDDSALDSGDDAGADTENGVFLASDTGDDVEEDTEKSVLLGGLSEARNLTLISEDNTVQLLCLFPIFILLTVFRETYACLVSWFQTNLARGVQTHCVWLAGGALELGWPHARRVTGPSSGETNLVSVSGQARTSV
jgi:hypothetical protein